MKGLLVHCHKDQWKQLELGFTIGPPHAKRLRGRTKKLKIRRRDEEEDGKRKVILTLTLFPCLLLILFPCWLCFNLFSITFAFLMLKTQVVTLMCIMLKTQVCITF